MIHVGLKDFTFGMSKFIIDAKTGVVDAKAVDYESVVEYLMFA